MNCDEVLDRDESIDMVRGLSPRNIWHPVSGIGHTDIRHQLFKSRMER